MNDIQELSDLRAEVAGRRPEDLRRARDLLLTEIRTASQADPARRAARGTRASRVAASVLGGAPAGRPPSRQRRMWPRAALIGGTAVAAAAAITAGLLAGRPDHAPPPGTGAGGAPVLTAAYVLRHAAAAAAAAQQPVPRPGQYIKESSVSTSVVQSVISCSRQGGSPAHPPPPITPPRCGPPTERDYLIRTRQVIWDSVSGQKAGVLRNTYLGNQRLPWGKTPPPAGEGVPGRRVQYTPLSALTCPGSPPARITYDFLTTLPTNPAQLRAWIYQHKNGGNTADTQAWNDIGDLLDVPLVPPKLAGALFQVAATFPRVTVVRHATDAAGRSGIAVSRDGSEMIFNPRTYALLGWRSVFLHAVKGEGPAGTSAAGAVLKVSVVNHLPHYNFATQGDGSIPGPGLHC